MRSHGIISYFALKRLLHTFGMNRITEPNNVNKSVPKYTRMNVQGQKRSWFPTAAFHTIIYTLGPDNPTPPVALARDQLYHSMQGQNAALLILLFDKL